MPYFTYDTSVIISRRLVDLPQATNFLVSAVVLMELAASATDASQRKVYEQYFKNWKDFKSIQRFCNVKIVKAAEFFKT